MILDALFQFSAAQAITVSAASTNVIDLGVARDLGKGQPLEIDIRVGTAFTAVGAATLQIQYQVADDAGFTTNVQTIDQTDTIPKASLVAGATIPFHIDRADPYVGRRYARLNYIVGTGPMTAGTLTAGVAENIQDPSQIYPSGFGIA